MMTKRRLLIAGGVLLAITASVGLWLYLHVQKLAPVVHEKFAGKRWELPARIYARPLEIYEGLRLHPDRFVRELTLMQYRPVETVDGPGCFARSGKTFIVCSRPFVFEDGKGEAQRFRLVIEEDAVRELTDVETGRPMDGVRLDPALIGAFYPTHNEDRILVKIEDVPPLLIQTLIAVEDRAFYRHHGIAPLSIIRAFIENVRHLRAVQGGSTLTQQLVKNFFLTPSRTLKRKIDEALMALILEASYEKDEILEAYLNEVYLGQDGSRAVHGFGLASRFYFGRPLADLRPHEVALLVGMLKGPSYYDPRRHPERARKRRNLVISIMEELKLIQDGEARKAKERDLEVVNRPYRGETQFPAYFELIKRRLLSVYKEEDLRSEGLRIFTTFDPQVQFAAEAAVTEQISDIEGRRDLPKGELETGAVILSTGSNEVLALIGGRDPGFPGFNRALDAARPIGSLIKPAIYLTALQQPDRYTLITPVDDGMLEMEDPQEGIWRPKNYDREYHGIVPLYEALVHSYNSATVRLGLEIGLENVHGSLKQLGFEREIPFYPSSLLGTMEMSPFEVARIYGTLAAGGFASPPRAILSVYTPGGRTLERNPVTVRQNFDPEAVYLLNKALQSVVSDGTARSLGTLLDRELKPAGKTGTTNDLKDSWFAGFTGSRLAAVWVGRDDNRPAGLTGASGALKVWGGIMREIVNQPLRLPKPDTVEWVVVDPLLGLRTDPECQGAVAVPFIVGSAPTAAFTCTPAAGSEQTEDGASAPERPASKSTFLEWLEETF